MIDWSPLLISLKTASLTMIFVFFLGLLAARWVVNLKSEGLKMVLDGLLTLPLVLPPTVAGYFLLYIFGVKRPIGLFFLEYFGVKIPFSFGSTVLAATVIAPQEVPWSRWMKTSSMRPGRWVFPSGRSFLKSPCRPAFPVSLAAPFWPLRGGWENLEPPR